MSAYNGWTNYATWTVALEWFDDYDVSEFSGTDLWELGLHLRDTVEQGLELSCDNETTLAYAMAFISDVSWYEIAEHLAPESEE